MVKRMYIAASGAVHFIGNLAPEMWGINTVDQQMWEKKTHLSHINYSRTKPMSQGII